MVKNTSFFLVLAIFALFLSSCKKDSISPLTTGAEYYPLRVGQYTIFDVDSIKFFDVSMTSDTSHYQIMELLDSSFTDNSGRNAFRMIRMKRPNDTSAWFTTDVWYTNLTSTAAERVEENLRFMKLIFPIYEGETWNGNKYINTSGSLSYLSKWNYQYSEVNAPKFINGISLDSTVTVTMLDEENLIQKDLEQEIYAKGKGLVYKIIEHVSKQNVAASWQHPEKGYIIKLSIREFHP